MKGRLKMSENNKFKAVFSFALKFAAAGLTAFIILTVLAVMYNYEGVHIKNEDGSTDYKWEPGQLKTQMNEGVSILKMDSDGFNNAYDLTEAPDILLMGSSHTEAIELMQNDNFASLLNGALKEYSVYNIGISGHTIYRCADNFKAACENYKPGEYVIIETDRISLDENLMREVIDGQASPIPSYDSGIMYYLQKIPSVKLIYSQLDKWITKSLPISFNKPFHTVKKQKVDSEASETDESYSESLSVFLDIFSACAKENRIKVIIFYHPSETLLEDGSVKYNTDEACLNAFSDLCTEKNIIFVDMTPDFEKLYSEKHIMAHGFSNTAAGVGHLNKYGHKAIADRLYEVIKEAEGVK